MWQSGQSASLTQIKIRDVSLNRGGAAGEQLLLKTCGAAAQWRFEQLRCRRFQQAPIYMSLLYKMASKAGQKSRKIDPVSAKPLNFQ